MPTILMQASNKMEGTCEKMCPDEEADFRIANCLVHPLESANPWENVPARKRKALRPKMVKAYSRPAAGKDIIPSQLRPFGILLRTTEYLLGLSKENDAPERWPTTYGFVVDRLRAVRQDLIVQELAPHQTSMLLESMIPYYLKAEVRCETTKCASYDRKLHSAETNECMSRWKVVADAYQSGSQQTYALYLLYYIDQATSLEQLIKWKSRLRPKLFDQLFKLILAYRMNNFVGFFVAVRDADELYKTALWSKIGAIRIRALNAVSVAYTRMSVPSEVLQRWLMLESEDAVLDYVKVVLGMTFKPGEPIRFPSLAERPPRPEEDSDPVKALWVKLEKL
ncbi:SAC3/GANP/Nin1/mts3/eIF-3 p25 [Aphelenchoides avenae]|nr:SAC3/GANP/Nin1/mts3/eIF-3 p25 [Aphelenchus avenae]